MAFPLSTVAVASSQQKKFALSKDFSKTRPKNGFCNMILLSSTKALSSNFFTKNWIVETRWRNSSMSLQVFWPMSHIRQMGSILGVPCCLQATQRKPRWDFCLDHLCTSSVVQAQSFLLQIPWPRVSKKKLEECPLKLNHTMIVICGVFFLEALWNHSEDFP